VSRSQLLDMNISQAQKDMRQAYNGGGTGAFVSGLVWILSGIVAIYSSEISALLTFFFGGMLIHPLGIVADKMLHRSGKHQKDNPLAKVALLSTLLIFIGLYIAYVYCQSKSTYFFPIMMLAIGLRYLIFQYLYGLNAYWVFGSTLIVAGIICIFTNQPFYLSAILGGIIEWIFSYIIIQREKQLQ